MVITIAEIKWIKLSVNMFDDEKIKLIRTMPEGESISMIWIQMLCLAGKINDGGMIYMGQNLAYSDEMLATILGHPVNIMRAALKTLEQFEMIEINDNGMIDIINWEKHQNIDGMAMIREQNRQRKRKFDLRKKLKELGHNPDGEDVPKDLARLESYVDEISNVNVTLRNAIEEDKNKKKNKNNSSSSSDINSVVHFYQNNIGQTNPYILQNLNYWTEEITADVVIEAIKTALEMNKTSYSYINGILNNWHKRNVKNIEDVNALKVQHENQKNDRYQYKYNKTNKEVIPEWANKNKCDHANQQENTIDVDEDELKERINKIMGK